MENTAQQTRSPWAILALLCIPVFVGSVDLTIVSAILPEVIVSLGLPADTRLDDAFWMITGYLLAYTISMVFVGRLSDLVGRRRVYIGALLIFMFGSFFVAVAHTAPTDWYARVYRELYPDLRPPAEELRTLHLIIAGRVIQALGAGAMAPVTMALVGDLFAEGKRARPIGLVGAVDTVGWMLGHLYGGVMVKFFGANGDSIVNFFGDLGLYISEPNWRTLFWINIVTGTLTLIAVVISLRRIPQVRLRERFDFVGTGLLVLALIGLNIGLGTANPEAPTDASSFQTAANEGSGTAVPLLIMAVVAFALFLWIERRVTYPLFDLNMFRNRNVSAASFANIGVGFALTIGLVAMPILVNIRESQSSLEGIQDAALIAGLLLSALTVPMALAALPGAWLSDRFGYRQAVVTGMGLSAFGFIVMALTWESDTAYSIMAVQMVITGTGLGLTIAPIGTAVIDAADDNQRGSASAMVLALRLVGMTLALSSLTDFAINRVNRLVGERSIGLANTDGLYLATSVDVVQELFFLGAAISAVALLVAFIMQGGQTNTMQSDE